ncbi:bifunctional CGI121-TPRKB superfamily/CGI121-TPRKB [Babesia duncani]|uniref:Bifunctional CGI121-TPRKB superfamily/CGI121-TPRKB n=1 Tax=Babesia duncani TaxID=323732 RepID=A0AAD9UPV2_9APIC|nr:bifunctional CGI121-TPRKB superfamily/CGI121-TPRKB [Babesia duncani]
MKRPEYVHTVPVTLHPIDENSKVDAFQLHALARLYRNVSNIKEILDYAAAVNKTLDTNDTDGIYAKESKQLFDFSRAILVIKPEKMVSIEHFALAFNRAVCNAINGKICCTNIATETIYHMASTTCVKRALEIMAPNPQVQDEGTNVLIVYLCKIEDAGSIDVTCIFNDAPEIRGQLACIDELGTIFKPNDLAQEFKINPEELNLPGGLACAVYNRIATRRI